MTADDVFYWRWYFADGSMTEEEIEQRVVGLPERAVLPEAKAFVAGLRRIIGEVEQGGCVAGCPTVSRET